MPKAKGERDGHRSSRPSKPKASIAFVLTLRVKHRGMLKEHKWNPTLARVWGQVHVSTKAEHYIIIIHSTLSMLMHKMGTMINIEGETCVFTEKKNHIYSTFSCKFEALTRQKHSVWSDSKTIYLTLAPPILSQKTSFYWISPRFLCYPLIPSSRAGVPNPGPGTRCAKPQCGPWAIPFIWPTGKSCNAFICQWGWARVAATSKTPLFAPPYTPS